MERKGGVRAFNIYPFTDFFLRVQEGEREKAPGRNVFEGDKREYEEGRSGGFDK